MSASTPNLAQVDVPEERARADVYGLLARLWSAPPDADVVRQLQPVAESPDEAGGHLAAPWNAMVSALSNTGIEAAAEEYEALFQGVGKPEVFLYGSYYLSGFLNERPLVALRDDLRQLGLARDAARAETEDHVTFVFEVMRYLIAGDDMAVCNLETQRRFFRAHLQPWIERLCEAVDAHPRAAAYRAISGLTRAFMQIETQAFDMLET
jgi:TorA maturation chaperone TorD